MNQTDVAEKKRLKQEGEKALLESRTAEEYYDNIDRLNLEEASKQEWRVEPNESQMDIVQYGPKLKPLKPIRLFRPFETIRLFHGYN